MLKMASFVPPTSMTVTRVLTPYAAAVENDAGGDLKIQAYWGGTLGRDPFKQYNLVTDGVFDIGFVQAEYSSGQFPDDWLFELPYLVRSAEEGSVAKWRMYKMGLLRGYDDIKVIGVYTTSLLAIHTRKPLTAVSDLKGMKIRASGKSSLEYVKLIGAVPVALPITEVTEAVSRGTVDGLMTNWDALIVFRVHNVVEHHFGAPLGTVTFIIPMNKKSWDGLSARAKAAVDKHGGEPFSRAAGKVYDDGDRDGLAKLKADSKRTFLTENPADEEKSRAMMKPIYDQWIASTPDGQKKFDTLKSILADIRAGR
jgi:TRAP-type C4-dicarboxylate transport system substrate-binding protein